MKIIKNKADLEVFLDKKRKKGKKIGLIPTMGSIHQGHLSLINSCKEQDYFSLVTIYINPTQFNELNDYEQYPRDSENDQQYLRNIGTNLLFYPSTKDIYPKGVKSIKTIFEYRNILCDIYRPEHFDGVTTVVAALFDIIRPDHVFFGEKDFQQLKIVQKMIENKYISTAMHFCPSIRMTNGMSYSSRYKNFSITEDKLFNNVAKLLMKHIADIKKNFDLDIIKDLSKEILNLGIKKIDYIEIKNEINLSSVFKQNEARLFVAFYIGRTRIIDNFVLY